MKIIKHVSILLSALVMAGFLTFESSASALGQRVGAKFGESKGHLT